MIAFGSAFDTRTAYEWIAQIAGSVAVWASTRASAAPPSTEDRIQDLTMKVRQPWRHRARIVRRLVTSGRIGR